MDTTWASPTCSHVTEASSPWWGGGKSTLLTSGGRASPPKGARVVLATSTHMLPRRTCRSWTAWSGSMPSSRVTASRRSERLTTTGKVAEPRAASMRSPRMPITCSSRRDGSRCSAPQGPRNLGAGYPRPRVLAVLVVGVGGFGDQSIAGPYTGRSLYTLTGAKLELPQHRTRHAPSPPRASWTRNGLVIVNQVDDDRERGRRAPSLGELRRSCPASIYAADPCRTDRLQRI